MSQKIKLGMVGGGQGAFIGAVHRIASRIDDRYELVAGAFSSNPEKSIASGKELGISEDRNYSNYEEMVEKESIKVVIRTRPTPDFASKNINIDQSTQVSTSTSRSSGGCPGVLG